MIFSRSYLKQTILAFSLLAIAPNSGLLASSNSHSHGVGVIPAQANFQDETALAPVVDQPIPFTVKNFRTHVGADSNRSVFEVKVPGLYSIDSFLIISVPTPGDTVSGYITINGRKLLTFFNSETSTSTIVEFHFNDRLVYLEKGDQVSVVLSDFTPGTLVLSRGFVMVALNNSSE